MRILGVAVMGLLAPTACQHGRIVQNVNPLHMEAVQVTVGVAGHMAE